MFQLDIKNDRTYSKNDLLNIDFSNDLHPALSFCKMWLQGEEKFTLYTSGSTGTPKKINITRIQLQASAEMTIAYFGLTTSSNALICLSANYIAGIMMLVRTMMADMHAVLVEPNEDLTKLSNEKISFSAMVPLQIEKLLHSKKGIELLKTIEVLLIGGAAMNDELITRLQQYKINAFQTYGMTETVSHIAVRSLLKNEAFYRVLPTIIVKQEEDNCISIKGAVTNNEWLKTNDLIEFITSDTFLWLGRKDRVINSGGIKIIPEQLENEVKTVLPVTIQNYFIHGIEDKQLGQRVVLFVETASILDNETILKNIKLSLKNTYHCPKEIVCINHFIYTATGKIDRLKTVEQVAKNTPT